MTPRTRTTLALVGVALLVVAAWWIRAGDAPLTDRIEVAGNVRAESRTVPAPFVVYPTPDYTVGIPSATGSAMGPSGSSGPAASAARAAAMRAGMPAVSGRLATVSVTQGDHVETGQVLAKLDTRMLDLGVQQAEAAALKSRTDVAVLGDNLDTIAGNQTKLADAKTKLASGSTQLTKTRARLAATRATLVSARAKALAGRSALKAQIDQLESIPATLTPQQTQILAALKGKLVGLNAGIGKMDAGIAKVGAGLAKIDAALAKLPSASAQLSTARTALSDAKAQVTNARDTLSIVAEGREVAIALAKARRDAATIVAPVAGVVIFARAPGTIVMAGAPVVTLRTDGPQLVDTYLTGEQLARVVVGKGVEVRCDSLPGQVFEARVLRIGATSDFPPTSFPTEIVHMTRAVRVTVALDNGSPLPAGTPVDLTILTDLP